MLDVLIRNGLIIDGTGKTGYQGDLGIEGDRLAFVGGSSGVQAAKTVDASGKVVCPGVVDPHSHADMSLFRPDHEKLLEPLVMQGITTFVGGNCGMGLAPLGNGNMEAVNQYLEVFTNADVARVAKWNSVGQFIDTVQSQGLMLNMGLLAPHGVIRIGEVGPNPRAATDSEIDGMCKALDTALAEGAIGLSCGLQYYPGSQSEIRELFRLGEVLKRHDGVFACHLRSYSNTLPQAIDEVIQVSRQNGINAQISHLFWIPNYGIFGPMMRSAFRKLTKLAKWWIPPLGLQRPLAQRMEQILGAIDTGANVSVDVMPTTTGFTHLLAFFPPWALEGTRADVVKRLHDPQERKRMRNDIEHGKMRWPHTEPDSWSLNLFQLMGYECCRVMAVGSEKNKRYEGMSLVDIAQERNIHPFDAACDLLIEEDGHVLVFESMAEPDDILTEYTTMAPLKHPEVSISTDTILMGMGKPSYLFYGCYPKFIGRYVRDKRLLSLETAIRKITSLPADHFRLKGRGRLEKGNFADVLVFDFDTIAMQGTFAEPDRPPSGIEHVFINGSHVVEKGKRVDTKTHGRVLTRRG